MHAIVYDAIHDEFVVPQPFGQAILTFRGDAAGEASPIRVILRSARWNWVRATACRRRS